MYVYYYDIILSCNLVMRMCVSSQLNALEAAWTPPSLQPHTKTMLLQAANLSDYLNDPSLVATVFMPTNDAFSKALSQYGVTPTQALQQPSLLKGVSIVLQ